MLKVKNLFFKTCPKSGRIVGLKRKGIFYRLFFPVFGLVSLIWFIVRVLPKPDRINYPCQQVAAPVAFTFLSSVAAYVALYFTISNFQKFFRQHRYILAFSIVFFGLIISAVFYQNGVKPTFASQDYGTSTGIFKPSDSPNTPIGLAKGIFPGRVVWARDSMANRWDETGLYFEPRFNSQDRIGNMLESSLQSLTGGRNIENSWEKLFEFYNQNHGKGKVGYKKGEKIVIKVNLNTNGGWKRIDAMPQVVHSVLQHLIDTVGVLPADITIYDAMRNGISAIYNYSSPLYPEVKYNRWGKWISGAVAYSSEINDSLASCIPSCVVEADYLINLASLKRHCEPTNNYQESSGQTGITTCAKNHFGSIANPSALHLSIRDWARGMGTYNAIVDLMSNKYLGGKTLVYLIDGTYGGDKHGSVPKKFKTHPFNNSWPSSIFASLDVCAIESVALDILHHEMTLVANADNFLHEAAQIGNPPSGINYLGKDMISLGVHEHWNNPQEMKYSRNLGKPEGIELVKVPLIGNRPLIDYFYSEESFLRSGDSTLIHWQTENADLVLLNGKKVEPKGKMFVRPSKTAAYKLEASKNGLKTQFDLRLKVHQRYLEVQAEDCTVSEQCVVGADGNGWTGKGWISITGDKKTPGVAEFELSVPHAGSYDFIVTYNADFPNPATLKVNEQLVSQSIGFVTTEGWNWKKFVYPVTLASGVNKFSFSQANSKARAIHLDKFSIAY